MELNHEFNSKLNDVQNRTEQKRKETTTDSENPKNQDFRAKHTPTNEQSVEHIQLSGIPRATVEASLLLNPTFIHPGRDGRPGLMASEKAILLNKITADLKTCEADMGNEFMIEVWSIVERQLAVTTNWLAKCGPFAVWKAVYKKASLKAQQDLAERNPVNIQDAFHEALSGVSRKMAGRGT